MAPWKFKTRAAGFIALAVLLAACQGSATTTSPTPTSSPAAGDDATAETDPDGSTATPADSDKDYYYDPALEGEEINVVLYEGPGTMHLRPYIPQFEEETGINVNLIEIAEDNIIEQEVIDFTTQAGAYDVVQTTQDGAGVAYFASAEWLEDLTPYLEKTPAAFNYDDFAPAIQAATSWPYGGVPKVDEARPYAMMQELTTRIFVYRESLFNDPDEQAAFQEAHGRELTVPTTTDELLEVAEFFTRPDENLYGISFEGARDLHLYAVWIHFLWAFDGREWDPATYEVELDSPEAKAATEFYIELSQYAPPGFNAASIAEAVEAFAQGQSAMSIIWGPTHGWAQGEDESLGAAGYAEIPGAKQYLVAGVGMGINTFSKTQEKKDASWSFISFAESPRIQEEMQRDGNAGPRISVYSNEEVTAEKPAETLSTKLASEKGHPWAMAGGVGTQFVQVVYTNLNRAIAGEATVDDALADAQAEATKLFEDAGLGG
ncbi:MAG TPA: extracellular solute-binding protein [Egibacteraceae bacterium]|nr:extracellular solute-binding protein [Egibacteraceae bacterium]